MRNITNVQELFTEELHKSLRNLYDSAVLLKGKLPVLFAVHDTTNPGAVIRRILIDSIQSLKPEASVPLHAQTWRIYQILTYRFVEQISQKEVADDLNLSIRQLRRLEKIAVQSLGIYLWNKFELEKKVEPISRLSLEESADEVVETIANGVDELKRLEESFSTEIASLKSVMEAVLNTVRSLLISSKIEVVNQIPDGLTDIFVQLSPLRQALFNLLNLVARTIPESNLYLVAKEEDKDIQLQLICRLDLHTGKTTFPVDELEISHQLVKMAGGEFNPFIENTAGQWIATLNLPKKEQIPILMIDDNIDVLRLVERHLSGTRFRFLGTSHPERALTIANDYLPRIILIDVMLPGIDGWELLGRLREGLITRSIPIIVCTFLPQEELALSLGAAEFLHKPFTRSALLSTLGQVID